MYERITKDLWCEPGRHVFRIQIAPGREPCVCDRHRRKVQRSSRRAVEQVCETIRDVASKIVATIRRYLEAGYSVMVGVTTRSAQARQYGYPPGWTLRPVRWTSTGRARAVEREVVRRLRGTRRFLNKKGGNGYFSGSRDALIYIAVK